MIRILTCLQQNHDWRLVALAGIVCFLGSVAAISLFHRARALQGRARLGWLLAAGAATGSAVWATHFIAVLAFDPGFPVGYDILLTSLSMVVAVLMSALGLAWTLYATHRWQTGLGGCIVGVGIACMHYLGMAGLKIGYVVWSFDLVIASILLAIAFGAAAMMHAARGDRLGHLLIGSTLLTLAIVLLHFTAMGAVNIISYTQPILDPGSMSPVSLSVAIAAVVGSVSAMCMIGALSDRSNRQAMREQNLRIDGALNNMKQGLCMFDADNRLVLWNQRYVDMYGIAPDHIWIGCTIRDLLDARIAAGAFPLDAGGYDADLRAALKEGKTFNLDIELKDGRVISVVNQPIEGGGWVATHEDITERKRAERDLEHTRYFLDTIIESVPSPIIVKDVPGLRYRLINRAAERHLGVAREAMLGKTAREAMPKASADHIDAEEQKLLRTGETAVFDEHMVMTPGNGARIVSSTRLPVMGPDGKPQYIITVLRDLTDRKRSEQRIAHMAHHDALTDLPNRAAFNECIGATIDRASASTESFALLCIDLDRFKTVNDVFGHSVGDALLTEVALRWQVACQGAFMARLGGDEFAIITPTGSQPEAAEALAGRLAAAVDGDIDIEGHPLRVSLTIGVALFPQDGADTATLVANAHAALYRAKAEARGSIRFFEPSMDQQLRDKRALQHDLRMAVSRGEMSLHYQPQARIDGTVTGFEALARWNHPVHGMVPPGVFIPLAEESGSIIDLGEWILRTACVEAVSWPRPLDISVNLSPVQFLRGDLPGLVHQVLLDTGLPPGRLELEITEGVLVGDFTRALAILRRLKDLGVRIAMDDFGTGYSSLSYLQAFPFDRIKIDKSFIANLAHSQQSATIIRAAIGLSHGLALPVMAEGVETEEQLRFLANESCDGIQGYYVGRPLPIADYAEMVGRVPFGRKVKPAIRIAS